MCVMEAVAYLAGEDWTDRPASVSRVISALLRAVNDTMNDADRQALRPLIPMLPGTGGGEELETARSWMVMDWHCRTWPSVWLRAVGCADEAAELEGVGMVIDAAHLSAVLQPLSTGRSAAYASLFAAMNGSIDEGLASAIAAAHADENEPPLVAARARIRSGDLGPELAAAREEAPLAGGWDADRRASWTQAWDAAVYVIAIASGTAQIAAVQALAASSAWDAGWNVLRVPAAHAWDVVCEDARSIGRHAALALAWRAAWSAAVNANLRAQWRDAAEAAAAAVRPPVATLQCAAIELVLALVDPMKGHVRS